MFVQLFHLCFWLKWLVVVAQVAPCFSLSLATPLHRIALVVKKQLRLTSGFLGFRCDHNWGLFWETDLLAAVCGNASSRWTRCVVAEPRAVLAIRGAAAG